MEREFTSLQGQRDLMQQEIDGHIHHIHTLKDSNFKLTEALETAVSKGEAFKQKYVIGKVLLVNLFLFQT